MIPGFGNVVFNLVGLQIFSWAYFSKVRDNTDLQLYHIQDVLQGDPKQTRIFETDGKPTKSNIFGINCDFLSIFNLDICHSSFFC